VVGAGRAGRAYQRERHKQIPSARVPGNRLKKGPACSARRCTCRNSTEPWAADGVAGGFFVYCTWPSPLGRSSLGLRKHENYEHRPRERPAREVEAEVVPEDLSGILTVTSHPGCAVVSESQAEESRRRVLNDNALTITTTRSPSPIDGEEGKWRPVNVLRPCRRLFEFIQSIPVCSLPRHIFWPNCKDESK